MICKLCGSLDAADFCTGRTRKFIKCKSCGLIFVPAQDYLSIDDERARYDLHDNTSQNAGYVEYLAKCAAIVKQVVKPGSRVLDFGAGKNAVLTQMLAEEGYRCDAYDPLYSADTLTGNNKYDCIVICEVIEHLRDINADMELVKMSCAENAVIIIRTQLYVSDEKFTKWWYMQDLTHINFFSKRTIETLAERLDCKAEHTDVNDIFILKKRPQRQ